MFKEICTKYLGFRGRFFALFLLFALNSINSQVEIVVHTDDFPQENKWILLDANNFDTLFLSSSISLEANTLYRDTIDLGLDQCAKFVILDSGNDGLAGDGFFQISFNNDLIKNGQLFGPGFSTVINCQKRFSCETPEQIKKGNFPLKPLHSNWFLIRPISNTYYDLRTISACDTKMWIYDKCDFIHEENQTGAIAYSDDLEEKNAGFAQILLEGGTNYYIRIDGADECSEEIVFQVVDLELKRGCLDPASCNFDPLANIDSGNCIYDNCSPDLIVNAEVFKSSLILDSIVNDDPCLIREGCLQGYGVRDIIRFTTQIENIGGADYIVGPPLEDNELFSLENCHEHWHYLGYAEYLLFDGDGSPQPVGFKNGFCALDFRCSDDDAYKYNCEYMGISAGCFDTYGSDLLCQWVDITDVPDGEYTLVLRVNHGKAPDFFGREEENYENNWSQVCISIDRSSGSLRMEVLEACPAYQDCLGITFGNTTVDCNGICGGEAHFGDVNQDGEVTFEDVTYMRTLFQDGVIDYATCLDLDGDNAMSISDLSLLENCIKTNPVLEKDPSHTHCEFPQNVASFQDTIFLKFSNYDKIHDVLQLEYKSNVSIAALDFSIVGILIDSVVSIVENVSIRDLSFENRITFEVEQLDFSKTKAFVKMALLYLKSTDDIQLCFDNNYAVLNSNYNQISTSFGSCIDVQATSITPIEYSDQMRISPNPVSNEMTLAIDDDIDLLKWEVMNHLGQVLQSSNSHDRLQNIDVSNLSPGVFYMKVTSTQGNFVQKFLHL